MRKYGRAGCYAQAVSVSDNNPHLLFFGDQHDARIEFWPPNCGSMRMALLKFILQLTSAFGERIREEPVLPKNWIPAEEGAGIVSI